MEESPKPFDVRMWSFRKHPILILMLSLASISGGCFTGELEVESRSARSSGRNLAASALSMGVWSNYDYYTGIIYLSNLRAGRMYSIFLEEDWSPVQGLSCDIKTPLISQAGSVLHLDLTRERHSRSILLDCDSVNGIFTLEIPVQASRTSAWASNPEEDFVGNNQVYQSAISPDGQWVAWTENFQSPPRSWVKNLNTGQVILLNSRDQRNFSGFSADLYESKFSADGRYFFFRSQTADFMNWTPNSQILRKDLLNPASAAELVSTPDGTTPADGGGSPEFHVSADGRYVLFGSGASNLNPLGATYWNTLYVKDMNAKGSLPRLISTPDGFNVDTGTAYARGMSADGRWVVYESWSSTLRPGLSGANQQILVTDLSDATPLPRLVSSIDGTVANQGNSGSWGPILSGDGRYVLFTSSATNLLAGVSGLQVFRKSLQDLSQAPDLVSANDSSTLATQASGSMNLIDASANGEKVLLRGAAWNFPGYTGMDQFYVKDMTAPSAAPVLITTQDGSTGTDQNVSFGAIKSDGSGVFFTANEDSYEGGASAWEQVYYRSVGAGSPPALVSTLDGSGTNTLQGGISYLHVARAGTRVVFVSNAPNFPGGTSDQPYVKDLNALGAPPVTLNSWVSAGVRPRAYRFGSPSLDGVRISADGRFLFYRSAAHELGADGIIRQIYRVDRQAPMGSKPALVTTIDGTTSLSAGGDPDYQISADGRYAFFRSWSAELGPTAGHSIWRKDMSVATSPLVDVTYGASAAPDGDTYEFSVSRDGRWILFRSAASNLLAGSSLAGDYVYVKDAASPATAARLVSTLDGTAANAASAYSDAIQISGDGRYAFFRTSAANFPGANGFAHFYRKDLQDLSVAPMLVSSAGVSGITGFSNSLRASHDGSRVVFAGFAPELAGYASGYEQIYYRSLSPLAPPVLVSSFDGSTGADGNASLLDLSGDGRYVGFVSWAYGLTGGTGATNSFVWDSSTGNLRVASSTDGTVANQGYSNWEGRMSYDGSYYFFTSSSSVFSPSGTTQVFRVRLSTPSSAPELMTAPDRGGLAGGGVWEWRVDDTGDHLVYIANSYTPLDLPNDQVYLTSP